MSDAALVPDLTLRAAFVPAATPRRVLVYAPLAYSTPHFETDLEIAQRHLDLGDEVELVLCDGELPSCQLNPTHDLRRCVQCVSRNLQGAAQLSSRVAVHRLLDRLTPEDQARLAALPREFSSQQALKTYRFDEFDAGMATLSSVIDYARSVEIDTRQHAAIIHSTLYTAVLSYLGMRRILAAKRHDRAYIYNGRWSMVRSAVRACERHGVPFYTHERGSDFRRFALYPDTLPHDKPAFGARIAAAWGAARGNAAAAAKGESFFNERRQRVEKTWFSFVKEQKTGRVPPDWDRPARRIVYFTSSEFEFAAIGETTGRIFPAQAPAAPLIARRLAAADPAAHLWIRVHPNDANTGGKWADATAGVPNVTIIAPEDTVDSYALLDGADRVLTFGSTIGVEATFWGKPSICADFSFWDGLDALYEAASEEELIELLTRRELPAKPRDNALQIGCYLATFGGEFVHFQTDRISDYEFKSPFRGRCLKPDYDDLRQRLLELHTSGQASRAAAVAQLCTEQQPQDGLAHSVHILSLLKLGQAELAIAALETAAKNAGPQLEAVLNSTVRGLLDAAEKLATSAHGDFARLGRRLGTTMLLVPAFAAVGQNLIQLAGRSGRARAA